MHMKPITAVIVLLLVAATSGCIDNNRINETQTTAQPNSAASNTPSAGQAQVSVNAQYQTYTPPSQYTPTPKPGYQYVQFYVTVKNLNDEGVDLGNPFYFSLFDNTNQGYGASGVTFLAGNMIKDIPNSHPGDTTVGTIFFEIKQGATPQKLMYNDFSNKVTVTF
jgi:Domain of unknown function (DUF4352)